MSESDIKQNFVSLTDALFSICKGNVNVLFIDYQTSKITIETRKFRIVIEQLFQNYSIYLTLLEQDITLKLTLSCDELMPIVKDSISADSLFCKLFEEWYSKMVKELLDEGDC